MTGTVKILWMVLLASLLAAGVFLSLWGIPAPSGEIRKVITIKDLSKL